MNDLIVNRAEREAALVRIGSAAFTVTAVSDGWTLGEDDERVANSAVQPDRFLALLGAHG